MSRQSAALPKESQVYLDPLPGPQTVLLDLGEVFEVFVGGNRGGGKTYANLLDWLAHQEQYGKKAKGLLIRRIYKELDDVKKEAHGLFPIVGGRWSESKHTWFFPNGSELRFRHLDSDRDANNYQGMSFTRIYVEEAGHFEKPDAIIMLLATLNRIPDVKCGIRLNANPGGSGAAWLRERYVTPAPKGYTLIPTKYEFTDPITSKVKTIIKNRFYIPCNTRDNPYTNTPEYVSSLYESTRHNPTLRRAWVNENDWDAFVGQFYPEFNVGQHVIFPFPIPKGWMRFFVIDWNGTQPCALTWWTLVDEDYFSHGAFLPSGSLICYKERYLSENHNNRGISHTALEVAEIIVDAEAQEPRNPDGTPAITYRVHDRKLIAKDAGDTILQRMSKPPYNLTGWRLAKDKRDSYRDGAPAGWDILRSRLIGDCQTDDMHNVLWNTGRPDIFWFSSCIDSIRTIPLMQHDTDKPGDMISEGVEDHLSDCARYAVTSRPFPLSNWTAPRRPQVYGVSSTEIHVMPPPLEDEELPPKSIRWSRIQ